MPLPLTLLCTPSSSLRDRTVAQLLARRPGVVVVQHDTDELLTRSRVRRRVLDASGVLEDEVVELAHGCVSCTLREDVLPALVRVASLERWEHVVLALPVPVLPEGVIDVVRWGRVAGEDVSDHVVVDTVATVVDALSLCDQLDGDELLAECDLAAAETDQRSLAELIACQVEQADVVAVAHAQQADDGTARTVGALVAHLAPLALPVHLRWSGEGVEQLVGTGRSRTTTSEDRAQLALMAHELVDARDGVATLVWRSDRPLDPVRLHDALEHVVDPVHRSHGRLQLANRPEQVLLWESAGAHVSMGVLADAVPTTPCCELVLTGVGLDTEALRRHLDDCLASHGALGAGNDPFVDALGEVPAAG